MINNCLCTMNNFFNETIIDLSDNYINFICDYFTSINYLY